MKKKKPWEQKIGFFILVRNYTALISATLLNLAPFGVKLRGICSPGFNCHACPWATAACPVGVFTFSSAIHQIPAFALAMVLSIGLLLGRLVCSFVCPFGIFQEVMYRIPSPKLRLPRWAGKLRYAALVLLVFLLPFLLGYGETPIYRVEPPEDRDTPFGVSEIKGNPNELQIDLIIRNLKESPIEAPVAEIVLMEKEGEAAGQEAGRIKKVFTGIVVGPGETKALPPFKIPNTSKQHDIVLDTPIITPEPLYELYYCRLCPLGGMTASLPRMIGETERGWGERIREQWLKITVVLFFLVFMILVSRAFCRTFCPLGAIYSLCAPFAVSGMTLDRNNCSECGLCKEACPVDLDPATELGSADCTLCGDCAKVCPTSSIRRTFGFGRKTYLPKTESPEPSK